MAIEHSRKEGGKKRKEGRENIDIERMENRKNELKTIFNALRNNNTDTVSLKTFQTKIEEAGIKPSDPRLQKYFIKLKEKASKELNFTEFMGLIEGPEGSILKDIFLNKLSVPDFREFCQDLEKFYNNTKGIEDGKVDSKKRAKLYAVSVCTVDGQTFQLGDHDQRFQLQSVCKAINYPIALHERGEEKVHQHVGREPSGRGYNGLVLNQDGLPHNPLINAGAIIISSLIKPEMTVAKRLKHIKDIWARLSGNSSVHFDHKNFKNEPSARNMALSYYMKEQGAFPEDADLYKAIELYGKCCSIEVSVDQLAIVAASLASGGTCPTTGDTVFHPKNVRDCLSLMLSCGMYDYSGEFAFLVGLPAKSGVSGAMMVVVPGLMGISIYSPPLDDLGNPVRGIEFCKELVNEYNLHQFDHVAEQAHNKKDPRKPLA